MTGVLQDKVVVVTGAAGGIGRACALLAAREGAKVLVNDFGGSMRGDDAGSAAPARAVAEEIIAAGGAAAANTESVSEMAGAESIVAQALETFGALHAIINPAGILRDTMLHKMDEAAWDAVVSVHLRGAYNVTRAALGHFREQGEGAFVHFTSTSGLIGNVGQANYAAAKLGVAGLSRVVALEGAARGVRSNVIAPFAWTRMVASVPVKDEETARRMEHYKQNMRADQVAPLAVALAAPRASATSGQIFAVRGNEVILFDQPRPVRSFADRQGWTPDSVLGAALPYLASAYTTLDGPGSVFGYDLV